LDFDFDLGKDGFHSNSDDSEAETLSPFDDKFSVPSGSCSSWGSLTSPNVSGVCETLPMEGDYYEFRRSRSSSLASTNPEYYGLTCEQPRQDSFLDMEIEGLIKCGSKRSDCESPTERRYGRAFPTHIRCASSIYSKDEDDSAPGSIFGMIQNELRQDDGPNHRRMSGSSMGTVRSLTLHPNVNILDFPSLGSPFMSEDYVDVLITDSDAQEYESSVESDVDYWNEAALLGEDEKNECGFIFNNPNVDQFYTLEEACNTSSTESPLITTQNHFTRTCDIKRGKVVVRRVNRSHIEDGAMVEIDEEEFDPMSMWRRRGACGLVGGNRVASSSF